MGWVVRYARVGNAVPFYAVRLDDSDPVLCASVDEVRDHTGRDKRSVQVACKEAREVGVSHFLD